MPTSPAAPPAPAPGPRWINPHQKLPRLRAAVQGAYLAFLLGVGWQFADFVAAIERGGPVQVARPASVEGFLPIAALVGLKQLVLTGRWDAVHPAGLTILLAALATALLARKAFCSWVCPVGAVSRALEWLGRRTLWRRRWPAVPRALDLPLSGLKVLLLGFFAWAVLVRMPLAAVEAFLRSPYNLAADARMLRLFTSPTTTVLAVLGGLVVMSLVVKHAWCRWLCPYGALLGLASALSPLSIRRDPDACNDCRACTRACPVEIPVHARLRVLSPECTGCMSCVSACTVPACLGVTRKGARSLSPRLVPAVALGVMLGAWALARAAGLWESALPAALLRWAYQAAGLG